MKEQIRFLMQVRKFVPNSKNIAPQLAPSLGRMGLQGESPLDPRSFYFLKWTIKMNHEIQQLSRILTRQ